MSDTPSTSSTRKGNGSAPKAIVYVFPGMEEAELKYTLKNIVAAGYTTSGTLNVKGTNVRRIT